MAKRDPIVTTCPICLGVDEIESMLKVPIQRANPPDTRIVLFCVRCVRSIVKAAAELDEAPRLEGVSDVATDARDSRRSGSAVAPAEATDPLVLQTQSHDRGSGVDRPEPEPAAGGEGASGENESETAAGRIGLSTPVTK